MAGTSINCLAIVLKELGWSYTRLIAELRRQAAIDGVVLPKTESLIRLISRWVNNHQQPDDFYRDLLSRATGRHRFELFSDEAALICGVPTGRSGSDTVAGNSGDDGLHGDNYTDTGDPVVDSGDGRDRCSGGVGTDSAALCESTVGVP